MDSRDPQLNIPAYPCKVNQPHTKTICLDKRTEKAPDSPHRIARHTNDQPPKMTDSKEALLSHMENIDAPESDPPPAYDKPISKANRASLLLPRPPPLNLPILNSLRSRRVILASQSPRRKHIMSFLGLPNIEIIPSNAEEDLPKSLGPLEYVLATATKKAEAVYAQEINNEAKGEPALILAADTVVVDPSTGTILEKPRSEAHHVAMLRSLRDVGNHKVYTALVAMAPLASARDPGYAVESMVEETLVQFDGDVTDELILAYVRTREGADKAGGYGLQGLGSILIEKIEGSADNVIGLPLKATLKIIETVMEKADDEDAFSGDDGEIEDE